MSEYYEKVVDKMSSGCNSDLGSAMTSVTGNQLCDDLGSLDTAIRVSYMGAPFLAMMMGAAAFRAGQVQDARRVLVQQQVPCTNDDNVHTDIALDILWLATD